MLNTRELAAARVKAKLTQRQMADAIGCTVNTYNQIENGKGRLTLDRIDKIIRVLNIQTDAEKLNIFFSEASQN